MLAYIYNEDANEPYYMPHKGKEVAIHELEKLGVEYRHIPMHADTVNEVINEYIERYPAHDIINLDKNTPREKLDMFFEEHLHEDAEVRFITSGCGYFDVRSGDDKWIRIRLEAGDFIILPAGIYHRFTVDDNFVIQALRLFELLPKWTPMNRRPSLEQLQIRQSYISKTQLNK